MRLPSTPGRAWVPIAFAALGSTLLFYSGVFSYLFAVPVQMVFTRFGASRGLLTAAVTGAAVLLSNLFQVSRLESAMPEVTRLAMLQVLTPLGLLAAIALFNGAKQLAWWVRLLAAGAIATVGALPGLRLLALAASGDSPVAGQLESVLRMAGVGESPQLVIEQVRRVVVNVLGLGMTAAVAANWWLGTNLVIRREGRMVTLRRARVADSLVWLVIAGLALVVLSWLGTTGIAAPLGWNAALIGSFLFGIQGLGLVQHLVSRRVENPMVERWILTGVLIALLIPGLNAVIVVALPLFGISEIWINYSRRQGYEGNSE